MQRDRRNDKENEEVKARGYNRKAQSNPCWLLPLHGITDNIKSLTDFKYEVTKRLLYWLNRRSQRKSYTWEEFNNMLTVYPLAAPKIYVNVYA